MINLCPKRQTSNMGTRHRLFVYLFVIDCLTGSFFHTFLTDSFIDLFIQLFIYWIILFMVLYFVLLHLELCKMYYRMLEDQLKTSCVRCLCPSFYFYYPALFHNIFFSTTTFVLLCKKTTSFLKSLPTFFRLVPAIKQKRIQYLKYPTPSCLKLRLSIRRLFVHLCSPPSMVLMRMSSITCTILPKFWL